MDYLIFIGIVTFFVWDGVEVSSRFSIYRHNAPNNEERLSLPFDLRFDTRADVYH
jgi:hypothetical protein